jgi:hypothetical protein
MIEVGPHQAGGPLRPERPPRNSPYGQFPIEVLPPVDKFVSMTDAVPNCPQCRAPMSRARVIPRMGGFPAIHSFECNACGEVLSVETDARSLDARREDSPD